MTSERSNRKLVELVLSVFCVNKSSSVLSLKEREQKMELVTRPLRALPRALFRYCCLQLMAYASQLLVKPVSILAFSYRGSKEKS